MSHNSRQSTSVWMASAPLVNLPILEEDAEADVCVVGAGIAGMTTAHLLVQQGMSVIVLDSASLGGGQTERTTAHLTHAIDDRYFEIERLHGEEGARLAADSHTAAIGRIESIVRQENIECNFERLDGYLFVPPGEDIGILDRELVAARRAGLSEVHRVERSPLSSYDAGPCLCFPSQAQFHPLKYLSGLARAIQRGQGRIFGRTHVESIEGGPRARVHSRGGPTVTCEAVVVATNTPMNDRFTIHTKQAAYLSYVISAPVPAGSVSKALYWDTGPSNHSHPIPYHYIRLDDLPTGEQFLIVGGEDHKTGQANDADERYDRLESWTRERFPMLGKIHYRWSGQVMETVDGLAFIGRNPNDEDNVFVATGDSGMGMTHGTIAGILLSDLIQGRENAWASLYNPSRKPFRAAMDYARENLNVAARYGAWFTAGDVDSTDELEIGDGAVIRRGLKKCAVYRDEHGLIHEFSASCPHLGCVVQWNSGEKTWDCPCHGSRFDAEGKVLQGPAISDLKAIEELVAAS